MTSIFDSQELVKQKKSTWIWMWVVSSLSCDHIALMIHRPSHKYITVLKNSCRISKYEINRTYPKISKTNLNPYIQWWSLVSSIFMYNLKQFNYIYSWYHKYDNLGRIDEVSAWKEYLDILWNYNDRIKTSPSSLSTPQLGVYVVLQCSRMSCPAPKIHPRTLLYNK